jgi:glycosyltransferase involved in cell wall biosynthesis
VVTTHGLGDDPEGLARRLSACDRVISLPYSVPKRGDRRFPASVARSWLSPYPVDLWKWRVAAVRDQIEALIADNHAEICITDFLFAAVNVPRRMGVPIVLFEHNVEYLIWKRLSSIETSPLRRAILEVEWRKVRSRERAACRAVDLTITVSEADRQCLTALAPRARISAIPTGVDTSYFSPNGAPERPNRLVFTGSMDWHPNEDAMLHFIDAILPRIRRQVPDVSLAIVGRRPTDRLRSAAERAGALVTGTVDDVRPFVREASVYVVPLRAGGGTRLKIFEALAMAKPVVSTTVGAEGLALTDGREFVSADDPVAFGDAVIALLRDPARRHALGRAGRRLVERRYSWEQVAGQFEAQCESVLAPVEAVAVKPLHAVA